MASKINVVLEDGRLAFCKVVKNLGYRQGFGAYFKTVEYEGRQILVKRPHGMKLWRKSREQAQAPTPAEHKEERG